MPQHSTTVQADAYRAAREQAAFVERRDRGLMFVSGKDRGSYLQGLLTNDVASLESGEGCYAAYLTPQGRMITDVYVYELGDLMLVTTAREVSEKVAAKLDELVFAEDVTLSDVTKRFAHLSIVGPESARRLAVVFGGRIESVLADLPEHGNSRVLFADRPAIVTAECDSGGRGFDVYVERPLEERLIGALRSAAVAPLDAATADRLRIEAGVPRFGVDMDADTIPLEAGIESRAISFTKGCYVGQEVIARVMHRGHGRVVRRLVGLTMTGAAAPAPGTPVRSGDRNVGRVTSSTVSPTIGHPIALAYVQRDFVSPGTSLSLDNAQAIVTALPFVRQ